MELFMLLALIYLASLIFGILLEKMRIPWIFGALVLGVIFSITKINLTTHEQNTLDILGDLGMLFLLYIIGFEMELSEYKKHGKYIIKAAAFVILFEALLGGLTLHYLFHYGMKVSFLVALSLATIGEAVLIPILDEFNLSNTKIGQMIIGIGTLDDIFEMISIFLVGLVIGSSISTETPLEKSFLILFVLIALSSIAIKSKKFIHREFVHRKIKYFLLAFSMFIFFIFVSIGKYGDMDAIAALLAGITIGNTIPAKLKEQIEKEIKVLAYGFFATLFFFNVGLSIKLSSIISYPILTLIIFIVSNGSKFIGMLPFRKLSLKERIIVATGICVRFSTSLVVAKLLFMHEIINIELYSALIASASLSTFIVPFVFTQLLKKYNPENY